MEMYKISIIEKFSFFLFVSLIVNINHENKRKGYPFNPLVHYVIENKTIIIIKKKGFLVESESITFFYYFID